MPQARDNNPFMKGRSQARKPWFRIDQAHIDDQSSNNALTKVYLFGEIGESWWGDGTSANDFVKLLSGITSNTIELHINSGGGSAYDGIAIYSALKDHDSNIEIHVDALAASAASIIAMAGDKIVMSDGAMIMIHDASMGAYGNADFLRSTADILDKLSNNGAKIYANKTGQTVDFMRTVMKAETWYDAQDAVEAGLADEVKGIAAEDDLESAKQQLDHIPYMYTKREGAPSPEELRRRVDNLLGDKQMSEPAPEPTPSPTPAAPPPPAPAPAPAPAEPVTEPVTEPVADEPVEPAPVGAQPSPLVNPADQDPAVQVTNGIPTFSLLGQPTQNFSAVQARLTMLEGYRKETLEAARNSFVDQLATDKKILEPQKIGLKEYAQSLTEEGYAAWTKTYEGSPALSILDTHVSPDSGPRDPADPDQPDELETAREIVKQHKAGGMKAASIEATLSFKKLKAADPNFSLDKL